MNFDALISRADEETLQTILSGGVLRLLKVLDPSLMTPGKLRELLLKQRTRADLLLDPDTRFLLLELLRPEEASNLTRALGLSSTDNPYHVLKTASFRVAQRVDILFDFFELTFPQPEEEGQLPASLSLGVLYGLFHHQRRAVWEVSQALRDDHRRVLLHMPTGAGKTRTAIHVVTEHLRQHEPTLVIWLAHSEELCEQAASEFEKAWGFQGNREIAVVRYWGALELDLSNLRDGFVVAGLPKMYASAKRRLDLISRLGSRGSLVIMDEAHQAIAPTYQLILEALVLPYTNTGLLGLTATPGRTWDDVGADERLAEFFYRRKVTLQVPGFSNPVDFLVAEGYLAKANYRSLFFQPGLSLTERDLSYVEEQLDLPRVILDKLAENELRNLRIIAEIEHLSHRHNRILVFAISVEHSILLAAVLQLRGLWAHSVTSKTPGMERRRLLEEYKNSSDDCRILCNFGVLTTGFDAPKTSAAVITRPTKSLVLYSQMVGRAIRGRRAGGNDEAEIVTVIDEGIPGFGGVSEAFLNWEDVW
jgi:superfamily II DNA or RNA helicase